MRKILIFWLFLVLSGCATTAKFEAKLDSFIGASEESLIAAWGVPNKEYRLNDGKKAVQYISRNIVTSGGHSYAVPHTAYHSGTIGGQPYSGTSTQYIVQNEPVQQHKLYCRTNFIINNGRVESWQHEGNNCVSY